MNRIMSKLGAIAALAVLVVGLMLGSNPSASAAQPQDGKKVKCTLAVSIYTGWMPWYYADSEGILKKWGDKYGVDFKVQQCVDYPTSLNIYAAGEAQALVPTNMDVLTLGVPSTAIIPGDFSDGNDAIVSRDGLSLKEMEGREITLVENSVSHYLFERACEMNGVDPTKVTIVNTSDATIGPAFLQTKSQKFTCTWNPIVLQIKQAPGTKVLFDSSKVPGEIQDLLVVNSEFLAKNPQVGKALAGAWYETLGIMRQRSSAGNAAIAKMAEMAANTVDEFKAQLTTTHMFWTPSEAISFATGAEIKGYNTKVRTFLGKRELLGKGPDGKPLKADQVGIKYPDGEVQGAKDNVLLTYDTSFLTMARDGKLEGLPAEVKPTTPAAPTSR